MITKVVAAGDHVPRRLRAAASAGTPYQVVVIDQQDIGRGADLAVGIVADPNIPRTKVIVLASAAHADSAPPSGDDISTLVKPIGPAGLYRFLVNILETTAPNAGTTASVTAGTTASVTAGTTASDDENRPTGTSDPPERGVILLAEDNDINQMVAVETLSMLGYRADVARDGIETVELASAKTYQAILMDCQMPRMDGYTAAAEVRHREPANRHIPIIAMTAGAFAEDRQRCLAAGMDDYLTKPIDAEQLRAVLERWTAGTRQTTR